jgi:hypothetical protein
VLFNFALRYAINNVQVNTETELEWHITFSAISTMMLNWATYRTVKKNTKALLDVSKEVGRCKF